MKRHGRLWLMLAVVLALVAPALRSTPSGVSFGISQAQAAITGNLISRVYVDKARYNPGNTATAGASEPVWPQMVMYAAMQEHWTGNDTWSLQRLQWYASRTAHGFVTPGEAVDWTNGQPLISTAAEPVTGAWYQMALLNYLNQFDPRLPTF